MRPVKVLVVDDSATMRHIVSERLKADGEIEVIGTARSAAEARQAIKELNPDVMTLDVEMPDMDGLAFLEKLMRLRPMPVVMVSTLTARGSETAIAALALGAIDCVVKPTPANQNSFDELALKVKHAASARCTSKNLAVAAAKPAGTYSPSGRIVAIGSSTGGVEALIPILTGFPANFPPTVITQHMPAHFTESFANRLNRLCAPDVSEAKNGTPLKTGHVYLAPGGDFHLEVHGREQLVSVLCKGDTVSGHRPSVDVLFNSVAKSAGANSVGVILTGMGRDGAAGLLAMRQAGARTIGQDQSTSVVYGMPKAAFEAGAVGKQLQLDKITAEILSATNRM